MRELERFVGEKIMKEDLKKTENFSDLLNSIHLGHRNSHPHTGKECHLDPCEVAELGWGWSDRVLASSVQSSIPSTN